MADITLFESGGAMMQRPAYLANIGVDEETRKLAGSGGGLRISIKGGVFRLLNDGVQLAALDERYMNVVVVKSSPDTQRTFYADTFVEGEVKPPTCWSANGITPDADVAEKQSDKCATCPQNIAGSGQNDSRACRFSRNLAVVLANDIPGKVYKMSLPAQSIFGKIENGVMPLSAYGKHLTTHNTPISAVVTELRFDTTSATPKIGFKPVRWLTDEEYQIAKSQGLTPEALEATKTTVFQTDTANTGGLAIEGQRPASATASVGTAQVAAGTGSDSPAAEASGGAVANAAAAEGTRNVAGAEKSGGGRGRKKSAPAAEAAASAPPAQVAEVMNDEEAQLMAQIAALKAKKAAAAKAEEPTVVNKPQASAAPTPAGAAAMLAGWDAEEEEEGDE